MTVAEVDNEPISIGLARAFADVFLPSARDTAAPAAENAAQSDVLTVDQVARWLGVNRKTVYAATACGQLPCGRIGRRVLLSRVAIEAWLAGRRR